MATVTVSRAAIEDGDLPPVCVVTGRPADGTIEFGFDSLPSWTWLLLLFGILPFLVASAFASERVTGQVPMVREVVERFHRHRRAGTALIVLGLIGWVGAARAGTTVLVAVAVAALLLGVASWVRAYASFINGDVRRDGRVRLTHVHRGFVTALETYTLGRPRR